MLLSEDTIENETGMEVTVSWVKQALIISQGNVQIEL